MEGHTDADVNGGDVIVILIALITGMTGISQLPGFKTYVCECGRLTHTHTQSLFCMPSYGTVIRYCKLQLQLYCHRLYTYNQLLCT